MSKIERKIIRVVNVGNKTLKKETQSQYFPAHVTVGGSPLKPSEVKDYCMFSTPTGERCLRQKAATLQVQITRTIPFSSLTYPIFEVKYNNSSFYVRPLTERELFDLEDKKEVTLCREHHERITQPKFKRS